MIGIALRLDCSEVVVWLGVVFSFVTTEMEIAKQSDIGQQLNARLMKAYA
jgi:hypothetical protein